MRNRGAVDYLVIGGGFYGASLALFLRSVSDRVMLVEAGPHLLDRASRVNQARVHTGFHYPRSALTAVKSMVLHRQFAADFPDAIVDDFQMLYAVARGRSKVSAKRFLHMFRGMGAPIMPATPSQAALFDPARIEAAFACTEFAFDFTALRRRLANQLDGLDIDLRLDTAVTGVEDRADGAVARLSTGEEVHARYVFNVTYSQINAVLKSGGLPPAPVKHELAEVALIEPPPQLAGYGVTVMDGPFFSAMPYPSEKLHSLTHVRYTPHVAWRDGDTAKSAYEVLAGAHPDSRHRHMILDARRYVPALAEATWKKSLFEVKTVLVKNEKDDGRPILYQRRPETSRIISIMGGKIDNIYDLFDLVRGTEAEWAGADARHLAGSAVAAGA